MVVLMKKNNCKQLKRELEKEEKKLLQNLSFIN
jgi:hypothetical protein